MRVCVCVCVCELERIGPLVRDSVHGRYVRRGPEEADDLELALLMSLDPSPSAS